jgi:hypothetical protein
MSVAIVLALILTPPIAILALLIVCMTILERLPTDQERIKKEEPQRQECLVCGSHQFNKVRPIRAPDQR